MRSSTLAFLLVLISMGAVAQEYSNERTADSLTLRMLVFPERSNEFLQPTLRELIDPADTAAPKAYRVEFLRDRILALPSTYENGFDLGSSLRLESKVDNRYQFLRTTLGVFLAGGEAYMVYRAVKKYKYIR